ncbi:MULTISPECIES: hypothetical protein [Pseudoalteromonas]|uniref:DUF456 domain-containing protein n=2 Tax=Pseudoalteromonas TaxID=53246 RepID=A0AB39AWN5_9GAMM|nr:MULTISPECIES: hypothetical protein [Pseudoalteromonas]KYL37298.1 hypothetical protein A2I96_00475 [Pseudoalteromonas spiralis]MDN3407017.1 hypothetical protein [Pseudoalteromonas sp. APC 3218]MDN3410932.1 hypothetical protein [Pseudoalteromonas sp. APC 3894]MDN3418246.1 hypothetical protein [Pseudoalteromonas sp. APC 3227]MDN3421943.1 hypothetical protein [Pseudoalteromonas sp. APC 3895]
MSQQELHDLIIYQDRYFEILTEFFLCVTGCLPRDFSPLESFSDSIQGIASVLRENPKRAEKSMMAFSSLEKNLKKLYSEEGGKAFSAAKKLDACKLNLGGSSRFLQTQLNATRKSLLYSDTVLIPDPVMPWLEKKRDEEKFNHVIPLQMAFFILHLSDIKGDEFDLPPFIVFPSFEKSLEEHDQQTQENSVQLITDVFSHYVDSGIAHPQDIMEFATNHPDQYFQKIEEARLFVSPGSEPGESVKVELENYKAEMRQWRSEDWCNELFSNGDASVVTNAIFERIMPNYHLLENADELRSHPFLCVNAQAHYYQLIANMKNASAGEVASFDPSTSAILQSLTSKRLDYLANIEDSQLVALRKTDENIEFRRELRDLVNSLPNTKVEDLGYVAAEVYSHIERAISKHEKQVSLFNDKYQAKHKYTALIAGGTLGVTMFPVLAPFLGALLPLGAAAATGKYVSDKLDEKAEIGQFSHSMMGVISRAKGK